MPIHCFPINKLIVLRKDFITFCHEFLSYKLGLTDYNKDISCNWVADEERYPTKVYRKDIREDFDSTIKVLGIFTSNFLKSDIEKINY